MEFSLLNLCVYSGTTGIPLSLCAQGAKENARMPVSMGTVSWMVNW